MVLNQYSSRALATRSWQWSITCNTGGQTTVSGHWLQRIGNSAPGLTCAPLSERLTHQDTTHSPNPPRAPLTVQPARVRKRCPSD